MKNRYIYITLLALLAFNAEAQVQKGTSPRLVVNISIDQLRSDYLELFDDALSKDGFHKLMTDGLVYEEGYYPFKDVDRSSAISSVITGTTPFYHTITGDKWIDRETLLPVGATPKDIAVSTINDELKIATHGEGKICSVSTNKALATLLAVHSAEKVYIPEKKKKKKLTPSPA